MQDLAPHVWRPRRRFPAFQQADAWSIQPLGQLLLRPPDYGVDAAAVLDADELPAYLRITDISEDGYYRPDRRASLALPVAADAYLTDGDLVVARTGARVNGQAGCWATDRQCLGVSQKAWSLRYAQRQALVERTISDVPLRTQAQLLGMSRSSL